MYEILFHKNAQKQIEKLPKDMQIRVFSVLDRIKISPHSHVKKLVNTPYFRLRVGDYRVILDIQADKLIIFVVELGHRKNIYD